MDPHREMMCRREQADAINRANRAIRTLFFLNPRDSLIVPLLEWRSQPELWQKLQERFRLVGPGFLSVVSETFFWRNYAEALEARVAELK